MLLGRIGVYIQVITRLTLCVAPCRNQIFQFIGVNRKTKTWEHFMSTLLIVISSGALSIVYRDITGAFTVLGGTCVVFITIIFPMSIHVKLNEEKWYSLSNLFVIALCIIFSILGFSAAAISTLDVFQIIDISEDLCISINNTSIR